MNPEPSETEVRPEPEASPAAGAPAAGGPAAGASAVPDPTAELGAVRAERDDLRDQLRRAQAELVNFQARMRREREAERRYRNEHLLRELVPVLDNFDRALGTGSDVADAKAVIEGIRLAQREIFRVLEQHGVKPFECTGQPFDPARQEVIETVADESQPDKQVVATLRRGYVYQDRILQVARVKIAVRAAEPAEGTPADRPKPAGDA